VLSDDPEWVQSNIESTEDNVYTTETENYNNMSAEELVGNFLLSL
jgi:hypothetical protein